MEENKQNTSFLQPTETIVSPQISFTQDYEILS